MPTRASARTFSVEPRTPGSIGGDVFGRPSGNDMVARGATRASPHKPSSTQPQTQPFPHLPTPVSLSPSASYSHSHNRNSHLPQPPAFEPPPSMKSTSSRYLNHTPYSPYKPGEYGRSERGQASERTKIERRLFSDNGSGNGSGRGMVALKRGLGEGLSVPKRNEGGSSPLQPAFEAKMVLRNGASVDLISWLRTNFHHISKPHTVLTPTISLIGIRALLLERFPRVPEADELSKTVIAAFPHSEWDHPKGAFSSAEPPMMRGLVWHGKDVAEEDDEDGDDIDEEIIEPVFSRARARTTAALVYGLGYGGAGGSGSRSPTQSTLVSPTSNSARKILPSTPARSVLDEFADFATRGGPTPGVKTRSLPGDLGFGVGVGGSGSSTGGRGSAFALANICNSFDVDGHFENGMNSRSGKRKASESPERADVGMGRRASTPDKLHGLLAAAEAVEGSPITTVLSHKRRRTIGGPGPVREMMMGNQSRRRLGGRGHGTVSPALGTLALVEESIDLMVPLNDTSSAITLSDLDLETASTTIPPPRNTPSINNSSMSSTSALLPLVPTRRPNELPTQGDNPGYDCKPPHPYHEMIRHAIETSEEGRLQLSQIYASISERFPFFKTLDERKTAGWQNSIRHNLSLKKMFVRVNKVDGVPDDGGKGGWWTVQPGVPDEGRPGRKSKGKKGREDNDGEDGEGEGEGDGEGEGSGSGGMYLDEKAGLLESQGIAEMNGMNGERR